MLKSMLRALVRSAGHEMPASIAALELNTIPDGSPTAEQNALADQLLDGTKDSAPSVLDEYSDDDD